MWLSEEIEIKHTADDTEGRVPKVPLGFINWGWRAVESDLQPDD